MVTDELTPVIPVVLSDRTGTMSWPTPRERGAEHFLPLPSGLSLFQETVCRAQVATPEAPVVVCDVSHRCLVEEQLEHLRVTPAAIVCEPVARSIAPAVAAAALAIGEDRPGALLLVLPSDHLVGDLPQFVENLAAGTQAAAAGYLVAFAIAPSTPEAGLGQRQGRTLRHNGTFLVSRRVVLAELLRDPGRREADAISVVRRPWGSYRSVDVGRHHQVKRIVVDPGQRLSLQRHRQRAEHWVVVQGTASIVRGEESRVLHENESVYIPVGCAHRLENACSTPLHLVEVQVGDYLGEDDIERLADDYGRT
jgi:mannose-6-phosphate isomerase-like protein (cupin superfamily)